MRALPNNIAIFEPDFEFALVLKNLVVEPGLVIRTFSLKYPHIRSRMQVTIEIDSFRLPMRSEWYYIRA